MTRRNVAWLFCLTGGLLSAQPFYAVYSFAEVTSSSGTIAPGSPPPVTGLSMGSFTAAGVSANPNASGRFSYTGWPSGAIDGEDDHSLYSGALSPFSYYEVKISVLPGYTLNLQQISFGVRRSGTGIRHFSVRSDLDSFTSNLAASTGTNSKLMVLPDNVFFWTQDNTSTTSDQKGSFVTPGTAYHNITGSVAFRFYAWNAEAASGSFSIDDVVFSGEVLDSALLSPVTRLYREECKASVSDRIFNVACDWTQLELRDAVGRLMWCAGRPENSDFPALVPGMYVLFVRTETGSQSAKLLVPFR